MLPVVDGAAPEVSPTASVGSGSAHPQPAPAHEASQQELLPRVFAALDKQLFEVERRPEALIAAQTAKPTDDIIGARVGGELTGDWDSALQIIPELLLYEYQASRDRKNLDLLVRAATRTIQKTEKWLRHEDSTDTPGELQRATETLRLNYLAVMVLVRRAQRSAELQATAQQAIAALFIDPKPPWPPQSLDPTSLAAFEEAMTGALHQAIYDLEETSEVRARDRKIRRAPRAPAEFVRRSLRAFLCLAFLPPLAEAPVMKEPEHARLLTRLVQLAGNLFRLASGVDPTDDLSCGWPPPRLFRDANVLTQTIYFVSGLLLRERNSTLESLELDDPTIETWLPGGGQAKALLKSLGSVPQAKDLLGALGLLAIPERNLETEKASSWLDFLHEARGPFPQTTGLYCYLPVTSGVAAAAIKRYLKATREDYGPTPTEHQEAKLGARPKLAGSAEQSLSAMRALRFQSGSALRGLPFAQFCMYNEMYLRSILLTLDLSDQERTTFAPLLAKRVEETKTSSLYECVRYILACRSSNGLFQQRYRSNEPDEGELFAAGQCIRTLALLSQQLKKHPDLLEPAMRADEREQLQRTIGEAVTTSALALLENQNASGGFATFERTDREKRGLLGSSEGPGAQEFFFYDAAAADTTAWVIEGLCQVSSKASPIDFVHLRPAQTRLVDRAIAAAADWLRRDFDPRAGWWARYGGGYVMGTACALRALSAAGVTTSDPVFARGLELLLAGQNGDDGGWGQRPDADDASHNDDPASVAMIGPSDPELTACAMMALLEAGIDPNDQRIAKARDYLLGSRPPSGGGWTASGPQHSFMQGWIYIDQAHMDLRPTQALLSWQVAATKPGMASPPA